jgi:hypothetical protein
MSARVRKGSVMSDKKSESIIFKTLFIVYILFAVHFVLALALFLPERMPLVAVIALFPAVCSFFCFILEKKYNKHIKPVNEIIKAIIHDKSPFFPPKSVLAMHKNIKAAGERIALIRKKMTKTIDYIVLLSHSKRDDAINGMISKQNEYYKYFFNYYDNYCSLYLDMRFQFYMEVMRDVLISSKKIYKIDIRRFIDTIKTDIKCMGYVLKSKNYLHKCSGASNNFQEHHEEYFFPTVKGFKIIADIEGTIAIFFTDENTSKKSKKQQSGKGENREKYDMVFEKTNASIKAINGKIQSAAEYLIALQSNKIIGNISPIDEENILNIQKKKNTFTTTIECSETLDDEYDRFMAEVELSEYNNKQTLLEKENFEKHDKDKT